MDGFNLDLNQLPTFIILVLVTVGTFKKPLGTLIASKLPDAISKFLGFRTQRTTKREDHERLIEELLLDSTIQDQIADKMRETRREDTLLGIIRDKDRWLEDILNKQLEQILTQNAQEIDILMAIRRNSERTNNILDTIHITLAKRRHNGGA